MQPQIHLWIEGDDAPSAYQRLKASATYPERLQHQTRAPRNFLAGEAYVLRISPQVELFKGWDETLVAMLKRASDAKPLITAHFPRESKVGMIPRMHVEAASPESVTLSSEWMNAKNAKLEATPFLSPHLIFAPANTWVAVPPDGALEAAPWLAYSARLWTHGYTLYQPDEPLGHLLSDAPETPAALAPQAAARMKHLLGISFSDDAATLHDLDRFGHGTMRTIDEFFEFADVKLERGEVGKNARKGSWVQPAAVKLPRIFVMIASYRDPECQHTVKDLFAAAAHPERVNVGIVWQYIKEEDAECFTVPYPYPKQVRVHEMDARESMGVCFARNIGQQLWEGEEYVLQIDSHMRFEPAWDERMIAMLNAVETPRAVLTTYPAGYTPPNVIPHRVTHKLVAKQFDDQGIFTMASKTVPSNPAPPVPVKGAFSSACMLFGPASIFTDVPYDPNLYFFGEEITLSARLWTHGYDIFHPNEPVIYHDWERKRRRTHFDDHRNWGELNQRSFARVRHLLGTEPCKDASILKDIEKYGLGKARSMADYQRYCGVDFARRAISPQAYEGLYPADAPQHRNIKRANAPKPKTPTATRKIIESPDFMVLDDFLPEAIYAELYDYLQQMDYSYINTSGNVKKVWDLTNGFPLRGDKNIFYHADQKNKPKTDWAYPSRTPIDKFIEHLNQHTPAIPHLVGQPVKDWEHYSVTSWLYPQGTALSMHDDGSGVYSGAYVYYLTPEWKPHWGGLLLVMDNQANAAIQLHKTQTDALAFHKKKWLHQTEHTDYVMDRGLAQCIFPKRNRIVFIHPDAYHMVTHINPSAGENVRMSLAGFFSRKKEKQQNAGTANEAAAKAPDALY